MSKIKHALLVSTSIVIAAQLLGATTALAAETATTDSGGQLDEVIVTATRREANLQKVPVAVTAITADQLIKAGAVSLRDLQFSVPNLTFGGLATSRRPDIALRGINSGTRVPGFEGSIGFYVDGIYQPFPSQWINPVADVERVEVLYGPQDTLFGKNTVAGAISTTTKAPTADLGGYATAEYGNHDYYMVKGAANVPIVEDKLFARVNAYVAKRDGYLENVFNGHHLNNLDQVGARIQLRYLPTDNLDVTLSVGGFSERQSEVQGQTRGDLYSTGNPRKVNLNIDPKTSRDLYDAHLTGIYRFADGGALTSTTAWATARAFYRTDEDGNPVDRWFTNIADHAHDFSQEFRYASAIGGKIDYIVGAFYLNTSWAQTGSLEILAGDPNSDAGGLGFVKPDGSLDYSAGAGKRVEANSYAVYGDARYHLSEQWTAHVGARLAYDDKSLTYPGQVLFGGGFLNLCKLGRSLGGGCLIPGGAYPAIAPYQSDLSKTSLTGSAGIDYQATPDVMIYGKVSFGEKGGGWNTDLARSGPPARFSPEKVVNYELGMKTELFDRHLRLNADIFYQDYQNKQETIFISITQGFRISNAASATIKGAEASATLVAGDFLFNGGVGYIDPKYDDFQCTAVLNCKGEQLVFSSKLTASGSIEYGHDLPGVGRVSARVEGSWRDKMFFTVPNVAASSVKGYALFNARASLALNDDMTEVYVFGKNIFDKTYLVQQVPGGPASPGYGATSTVLYGPPRMIGLGVSRQF